MLHKCQHRLLFSNFIRNAPLHYIYNVPPKIKHTSREKRVWHREIFSWVGEEAGWHEKGFLYGFQAWRAPPWSFLGFSLRTILLLVSSQRGFCLFCFLSISFFFFLSKIGHGTLPQSLSYSILQSSHLSPCHMHHRISLRCHALQTHSCFQERDTIKQEYMPLKKEIVLFVRTVESSNFTQRSTLRLF